jgi:hypothetical protein
VIGVPVAKLTALGLVEHSGIIPERINYAIPIDEARWLVQKAYPFGIPQTERSSLTPKEIYAELKKATLLVLTAKLSQTGDTSQSGQQFYQERGVNLTAFIEAFIDAGGSNFESCSQLPFYCDSVDYFDNGVVDRAFIVQDIQKL